MIVAARTERGWTALTFAVETGITTVVDAIVSLVERTVPDNQVLENNESKRLYLLWKPRGNNNRGT